MRHEVVGARADHEWAGDARIRDVLTGLFGGLDLPGFPRAWTPSIGPLSGGERRRIALAKLLIAEQDLLILDEPTNHLDVEGIAWLAAHLRVRRSALVCVTHDRWFLDQVCTRTWEVQRGAVYEYEGGYSDYVFARAERERRAATEETKRQNLARKELAWLRRGAPARTSKPRFRIEAANALIADVPPPRDSAELMRFANSRLGRTVFDLEDVTVTAGPKTLLRPPDLAARPRRPVRPAGRQRRRQDHAAAHPAEAACSGGDLQPEAGGWWSARPSSSPTSPRRSPNSTRHARAGGGRDDPAAGGPRQGPGDVRLPAVRAVRLHQGTQWTPVGDLSGGERRRLQMLRLLMDEPNVLFLDEPTNDLDIETLTQLEDLLDGWPGSLVVVSHDRYFLERTTDRVFALLGDAACACCRAGWTSTWSAGTPPWRPPPPGPRRPPRPRP